MTDGPGDGGALGRAGADRDRHTDRVGDLTGSLDSPGVAHPPGLGVAVGSRGVTSSSSNRSSSVSGSVESIGISLSIGLTLANVVVDKSSSIANSLNSSSNTSNTDSSSRGDRNTSNTRCVSNNVGGVGNVDGGLGADLLGDVLAVLDGGGVDDGGDLVMALLLLVALLLLDNIDNIVAPEKGKVQ